MANVMLYRWAKLYKGTPAEWAMEDAVAELGVPYRTNFAGFLYGLRAFPDVFLPTIGVVIEIDGKEHRTTEGRAADAERSEMLKREWGVDVVRATNEEALENPRGILQELLSSIGKWPIPTRTPTLSDSLPKPKRSPAKNKRAAASERLTAKRKALSARRRRVRGPREQGQTSRSPKTEAEAPQ